MPAVYSAKDAKVSFNGSRPIDVLEWTLTRDPEPLAIEDVTFNFALEHPPVCEVSAELSLDKTIWGKGPYNHQRHPRNCRWRRRQKYWQRKFWEQLRGQSYLEMRSLADGHVIRVPMSCVTMDDVKAENARGDFSTGVVARWGPHPV